MELEKLKWDYIDDYHFAAVDDIEINIRAYNDKCISVWIYNHKEDKEILDEEYKDIKKVQEILNNTLQQNIKEELKEVFN